MANVSLKTDFKNGDKLYDYELNNNFRAIKAALEAMNKITWQDDDTGTGVSAYKGDTDAIEDRELIDGQLLYNTETGETYIDTYIDDTLTRINTGSGNVVAIQDDEPTNDAVKLWIETDTLDGLGSEIVNEYSESTGLGYSADYVNKNIVASGSNTNGSYVKYADGTMICYNDIDFDFSDNTDFWATWTRSEYVDVVYSATFTAVPKLIASGKGLVFSVHISSETTTGFGAAGLRLKAQTGDTGSASYVAIGRWK